MGYQRNNGESVEQYVDRIRSEAANGVVSSGPGGSLVQHAIDQARGFGSGSGGRPENRSQQVSDNYFANTSQDPVHQAGDQNKQIYQSGSDSGGGPQFGLQAPQGQQPQQPGMPMGQPYVPNIGNFTPQNTQNPYGLSGNYFGGQGQGIGNFTPWQSYARNNMGIGG